MNILVLGGTQFVGRHIVEALLPAGHTVSILTRGKSPDALPAAVERLRGDRDAGEAGLAALGAREWDACVDVSGYTPRQVRASAALLCRRIKRYLYVSTVSVYGDPTLRPVREDAPLLPLIEETVTEVNGETYGRLKATGEAIVREIYGESCALLRPQVVAGPHDPTGRTPYWVRRGSQGGEMLAPGDGSDHLQVIDARDLARFVVTALEDDLSGAYNLAGHRLTWAEFMALLGAEKPVWVPAAVLESAGVNTRELPLYIPDQGAFAGFMEVSNERAAAAGLTLTAPAVTLADTRAWLQGRELTLALTPAREAELIALTRTG